MGLKISILKCQTPKFKHQKSSYLNTKMLSTKLFLYLKHHFKTLHWIDPKCQFFETSTQQLHQAPNFLTVFLLKKLSLKNIFWHSTSSPEKAVKSWAPGKIVERKFHEIDPWLMFFYEEVAFWGFCRSYSCWIKY